MAKTEKTNTKKKSNNLVVAEDQTPSEVLTSGGSMGPFRQVDVEAETDDSDEYDYLDLGVGSKFEKELNKVYSKYKPSDEELRALSKEMREKVLEREKESKELKTEARDIPMDEEERELMEKKKAMEKMKTDVELKETTAEFLERDIQAQYKLKQLTDPRIDPMVSFDARQKAANKRLDDAYAAGLERLEGITPEAPTLKDDGIDMKQAIITSALQSMTGIMGAVSGRQAGYRASAVATEKGVNEMISSIESRQKHNAGLMKAYNMSLSKNREDTQAYMTAYLKAVDASGRNEITEFVKHSFNIEKIAVDNRKAALDEGKAKLDRLKFQGEVSDKQYAVAIDAIENEKAGLDSFQGRMISADKNDITAQKANLMASLKQMKLHLANLKRRGLGLRVTEDLINIANAPSIVSEVNDITSTKLGKNHWKQSIQSLRGYTDGLKDLDTIYTLSELRSNGGKRAELEHTISSLHQLLTFMETTNTVPVQAHLQNLASLGLKASAKGYKYNEIPGFHFRTARNRAELKSAQWKTMQKSSHLTSILYRAIKSADKLEEKELAKISDLTSRIIAGGGGKPKSIRQARDFVKGVKALKKEKAEEGQ